MPHSLLRPLLALALAFLMLLPGAATAADATPALKIDLDKLLADTQVTTGGANEINLVWWVPMEFWVASFDGDTSMTESEKKAFYDLIRPYMILVVVRGHMHTNGEVSYLSEADIRANLQLIGNDGRSYSPLEESSAHPEARALLAEIRPILSNAAGKFGENMRFYLFPAQGQDGKLVADPRKTGQLTIKVMEEEIRFRLPLGSVLPAKFDTTTGEQFPGNFDFNPYTGNKLNTRAPASR